MARGTSRSMWITCLHDPACWLYQDRRRKVSILHGDRIPRYRNWAAVKEGVQRARQGTGVPHRGNPPASISILRDGQYPMAGDLVSLTPDRDTIPPPTE